MRTQIQDFIYLVTSICFSIAKFKWLYFKVETIDTYGCTLCSFVAPQTKDSDLQLNIKKSTKTTLNYFFATNSKATTNISQMYKTRLYTQNKGYM